MFMPRFLPHVLGVAVLAGCAGVNAPPKPSPAQHALRSGVELQYVDRSVRPQDDLYQYLNGKWLRTFQVPADKGVVGSFTVVQDRTEQQLRTIVESLDQAPANADEDSRKLADLYASYMDEVEIEALGLTPLQSEFAAIDAIKEPHAIPSLMARMTEIGAGAPFGLDINLDARNSAQYAVIIHKGGLGLPDRDYYLKEDAKLKEARAAYRAHIEKMLSMAGEADAAQHADAILNLETSLAKIQWTRVENRDPIKTYNKSTLSELSALMPGYDWPRYARSSGIERQVDFVIVSQPTYFTALGRLMTATPLPVRKADFKWRGVGFLASPFSKP